jgi:hypothetical protein
VPAAQAQTSVFIVFRSRWDLRSQFCPSENQRNLARFGTNSVQLVADALLLQWKDFAAPVFSRLTYWATEIWLIRPAIWVKPNCTGESCLIDASYRRFAPGLWSEATRGMLTNARPAYPFSEHAAWIAARYLRPCVFSVACLN